MLLSVNGQGDLPIWENLKSIIQFMVEVRSATFTVLASVGSKVYVNGKWPVNARIHSFSKLLPNQGQ